jgi:hypothetical protein
MTAPRTAEALATEAIAVICNSGVPFRTARRIFHRVMEALKGARSAREAFGHHGKADAVDWIWMHRERLFASWRAAQDKVNWCSRLPWIGPVTKVRLARKLGADVGDAAERQPRRTAA